VEKYEEIEAAAMGITDSTTAMAALVMAEDWLRRCAELPESFSGECREFGAARKEVLMQCEQIKQHLQSKSQTTGGAIRNKRRKHRK